MYYPFDGGISRKRTTSDIARRAFCGSSVVLNWTEKLAKSSRAQGNKSFPQGRDYCSIRLPDLEGVTGLERRQNIARRHPRQGEAESIRAGESRGRGNEAGRPHYYC